MKIGSLFDGSGGFPLAGTMCGFTPVWASEVEPYPISVTRSRFPNMKHLGDISKVNGSNIEPVDIITFGSPCQDLSVAGKRAGLKHEENGDDETTRSGLFMEAVRIIKEMRGATNGEYPRFAVWENVPGAFSSNGGEDFRIVLQELIKITEPNAIMPEVPKNGWAYADSYNGDGWSLAYRVFDAQYWGVPQRHRRIYLVADFRGECAEKILFEREGLRGYFKESGKAWQEAAANAEGSTGADDREGVCLSFHLTQEPITSKKITPCISSGNPIRGQASVGVVTLEPGIAAREGGHIYEDVSGTLRANMGDNQMAVAYGVDAYNQSLTGDKTKTLNSAASDADPVPCTVYSVENHPADSRVNLDESGKVQTLTSRMGTGGGNVPMVMEPAVVYAIDKAITTGGNCTAGGSCVHEEIAPTLTTDRPHAVAYGHHDSVVISRPIHSMTTGDYMQVNEEKTATLLARDYKDPTCVEFYDETSRSYIVRRLTPTECARLQGFPDEWGHIEPKTKLTDDEYRFWLEVRKTHDAINERAEKDYVKKQILTWYNKLWTDSSEYKMWGNGIALPCALYVMQGIKESLVDEQSHQSNWLDDFLRRWSAK